MGDRIVVLVERNIGPELLLGTHLARLGHAATVLSAPDEARERIQTKDVDWVVVDQAAVRRDGAALRAHLARLAPRPRLVWLGPPLPAWRLSIEARFDKPLDYRAFARFFSVPAQGEGKTRRPRREEGGDKR